jgi:hypothetical protein
MEIERMDDIINSTALPADDEVTKDEVFTYQGYQVVRGEFFAHIHEPAITFNNCKISLNAACVNKLPDVDFVQILVNPEEMKLAVRPCGEDAKDSFPWCGIKRKNGRKQSRQITCRMFFAKTVQLMGWNPDHRYKMMGKLIQSNDEYLFIFDLKATEVYQRISQSGEKPWSSRVPVFPAEWQDQFGLPVEEHRKSLQVNIFNGYAIFGMKDSAFSNRVPLDNHSTLESEGIMDE